MANHDQKTEQPTQRKLQKSREHGQFLSAREFVGAIQFVCFAAIVGSFGSQWVQDSLGLFRNSVGAAFNKTFEAADAVALAHQMVRRAFLPLLYIGTIMASVSLGTQLVISGMGFSWKKLSPSFGRLNPMWRLRELASQAAGLALHSTIVILAVSLIAYSMLSGIMPEMLELPLATVQAGSVRISTLMVSLLWKCATILIVFGAIDLFRQKQKLGRELRMTKQEIRDEVKETEGNMQIKARIRRLRSEMLRRRMMSQVPHATAVIVNPTHYAVAIEYDPETMPSPIVVAKGKNYLALRIREKATAHQVPIVENPPLARVLYKSAEVGQQIPVEFYRAVAEILAYLYRMMNHRL